MMDIKKEREAFEEYISNLGLVEFDEWNFKLDECEEYLHEPTNISWGIWIQKQAEINELKAKLEAAQVPEGFVLVPKEPTGKMISAGYESKEHINNLIVNYKAMIEAAQGEGYE